MKRLELKVGIFVLIGLILIAGLMLTFSRSGTLFSPPTYTVKMRAPTAGGLILQAPVHMAGVEIGRVSDVQLEPDGKSVLISLKLNQRYQIHSDAQFAINSLNFLGDQYVEIHPLQNKGPILKDGEIIEGEPPFDFQQAARASLGLIKRVDETAQRLNNAIRRVDEVVLAETNLLSLSTTIHNFQTVSENAIGTVDQIGTLFRTNESSINGAVSNLAGFSTQLNKLADELNETVVTNRIAMTAAMKNLETASRSVTNLLGDLEAGKGTAGALLKDPKLQQQLSDVMANARSLTANLDVLSSNINHEGLWHVLWKPKPKKEPHSSKK